MLKKIGILLVAVALSGCSSRLSSAYARLSGPEKTWVILHPFKAKKAYPLAAQAIQVADSLSSRGQIDRDNNGGTYDAFKHSFWMASTAQLIGEKGALGLGKAHEKGNYKAFKQHRLEDEQYPDKPSSEMDSHNNLIGARIGANFRQENRNQLIQQVLSALQKGTLRRLLKDQQGNFLDCSKLIIPSDSLKNRWDTKKCIIPTQPSH